MSLPDAYRLRAEFIYPMDELLVERSLLGTWVETEVGGKLFELALPTEPRKEESTRDEGFERFAPRFDYPFPEGAHELHATTDTSADPTDIAPVDVVRISVTWQAALAEVRGRT